MVSHELFPSFYSSTFKMPSPPKPWEVNNVNSSAAVINPSNTITTTSSVPDVPARSTDVTTPTRPAGTETIRF